jgi:hypothetical protein
MGPRGASRSTARLLQKTLATVRSWANLSSAPSRSRPTLPTPVSGQVRPKDGVIEDAGALVNEKITDVACLRVTMDVFKDTLHPALYV